MISNPFPFPVPRRTIMNCPRMLTVPALFLSLFACQEDRQQTIDLTALEAEGSSIAQRFIGTLQPTLQQAMQSGGPVSAIEVCAVQAPAIASALSEETGWGVRRVSLKARNQQNAEPDAWEREVLQAFDQRQQQGEAGADISIAAVVDGEFRYMQAQAAGPLCLTCHGADLAPEVSAALAQHYPSDMATGYSAGEIRGAISLRQRE
jgi:hypothetical protein